MQHKQKLYFSFLIPSGNIRSYSWVRQFLPFLLHPSFLFKLLTVGPFVNMAMRPFSGLIGVDKFAILSALPEQFRGRILFYRQSQPNPDFSGWTFPLYIKPVVGERSIGVRKLCKIEDFQELHKNGFLASHDAWIVQEAFAGIEYGLSFVRDPHCAKTTVMFLTEKIVRPGAETASIVSGAVFKDVLKEKGNELALTVLEEKIESLLYGYFSTVTAGRFDVKAKDIAALLRGEFKIIELNGIGGMPLLYFEPNCYPRWNDYFLHVLSRGNQQARKYSFLQRAKIILADIPSLVSHIRHQEHFRKYCADAFSR